MELHCVLLGFALAFFFHATLCVFFLYNNPRLGNMLKQWFARSCFKCEIRMG